MATGKTNRVHFRLILDEIDLSGDAQAVGSFGSTYTEADVTGWKDGIINFTLGHPNIFIEGFQAVFNNTANTGSHTELSAQEEYLATLAIGIRAAPAVGDPCFSAPLLQSSYTVDGSGPMLVSTTLNGPGQSHTHTVNSVLKPWGVVLAAGTQLSATTNGTSVDNGASSSNGGVAYLHIIASSGGTWSLKVQDSANDITWADLITFSSDGSAITAEQGTDTGTIDQYLRFQATRTSGTVTPWCTFVRL